MDEDYEEMWKFIDNEFKKAFLAAEEEWYDRFLFGAMSGQPTGVIVHPNGYEVLIHASTFTRPSDPLLLDELPSWPSRLLSEREGPGWSEEAFKVQILRQALPLSLSPIQAATHARTWNSDHGHSDGF